MKTHAIIPIFIPHKGCPNDCVFCNQKKITARADDVTPARVSEIIDQYLQTIENRGIETVEVAFFGGSFTGIPLEEQSAFLEVAQRYKSLGKIDKIHLSTRPDYINDEILTNLKKYSVDIIELGVQSFDEEVLAASGRGHGVKEVFDACELIHRYGFTLGIQLMIGLPADTKEKCIKSAKTAVSLRPKIARLYPTVVIRDTELSSMLERGEYEALSTQEAVEITKEMYKILTEAGINVIRVGLKSTDLISESSEKSQIEATGYHPAFRQLVEGEIARESLESQVLELFPQIAEKYYPYEKYGYAPSAKFVSNSKSFSNMIGHKASNKTYFKNEYIRLNISYIVDDTLADGIYKVIK